MALVSGFLPHRTPSWLLWSQTGLTHSLSLQPLEHGGHSPVCSVTPAFGHLHSSLSLFLNLGHAPVGKQERLPSPSHASSNSSSPWPGRAPISGEPPYILHPPLQRKDSALESLQSPVGMPTHCLSIVNILLDPDMVEGHHESWSTQQSVSETRVKSHPGPAPPASPFTEGLLQSSPARSLSPTVIPRFYLDHLHLPGLSLILPQLPVGCPEAEALSWRQLTITLCAAVLPN